ncbi:phage N-6-adenine-methyltransferase [Glaciecola sp. 2405UD65-10]|uniref:phage N-6-adenine-methyltransferase n=1 Tax=Glaciecola sp. 2405UD65-10 TaxID=3397244 RepID=UPI003B5CB0C0
MANNNNWKTPKEVFAYFNATYGFILDAAASDKNALCHQYITEEFDCLKTCWGAYVNPGSYAWLNPPYSRPLPFVKKALEESRTHGIGTVLLLNCDLSVEWSKLLTEIQCELIILTASGKKHLNTYKNGRIAFLNEHDKPADGNAKGQMVAVIPPYVRWGSPTTTYLPLTDVMTVGADIIRGRKVAV